MYKLLLQGNLAGASAVALGAVGIQVASKGYELLVEWDNAFEKEEQAEQLVRNINADSELLKYTTPEVKGRILALITSTQFWGWTDEITWPWEKEGRWYTPQVYTEREKAVQHVLSWVQSQRDCQEVLEHMGINIPKSTHKQVEEPEGKEDDPAILAQLQEAQAKEDRVKATRLATNKSVLLDWLDEAGVDQAKWDEWHAKLPAEGKAETSSTAGAVQVRHFLRKMA